MPFFFSLLLLKTKSKVMTRLKFYCETAFFVEVVSESHAFPYVFHMMFLKYSFFLLVLSTSINEIENELSIIHNYNHAKGVAKHRLLCLQRAGLHSLSFQSKLIIVPASIRELYV